MAIALRHMSGLCPDIKLVVTVKPKTYMKFGELLWAKDVNDPYTLISHFSRKAAGGFVQLEHRLF